MRPQHRLLPDQRRLHLHHGPIDLILGVDGPGRVRALQHAVARFDTVLDELVGELALLRAPACPDRRPEGGVARAMHAAVLPFRPGFVTPMAAVAGAVADAVLAATVAGGGVQRAHANNGGDVALYLEPGEAMRAAVASGARDRIIIRAADPVRGVATSGWRGRSHSLGIADTVTVLAADAARADAAATLIANAVDLPDNPRIHRRPATDLSPDSDLGTRAVTVAVDPLSAAEIAVALDRGQVFAQSCHARGLIHAAFLTLSGQHRIVGPATPISPAIKEPQHA